MSLPPSSADRLALMETFVRIVEAGSLSSAAAQLGATQPTVSRRLQALERSLGLKLIRRSTHSIVVGEPDPSLVAIKLSEVPRIVVAAPSVVVGCTMPTHASELGELPWLALQSYYRTEVQLTHAVTGETHRVGLRPRLGTDSLYALRNAALAGAGVCIASSWLVHDDIAQGRLVQLVPDWRAAPLPVYLVYPYARFYPARLRRFVEAMRSTMAAQVDRA